jgi:hypothetical protein
MKRRAFCGPALDPVGVLENHPHRAVPCLGFELTEQRLEEFSPVFATR